MFTIKMKKNKKSQAEIVGLVIIVLLITIGILFFVKFVVLKEPSDTKNTFINSELANNMLDVLLRTTTDCKESSVSDLFQDCATFKKIGCDGLDSCEKVNETIELILTRSLDKWSKQYEFRAYKSNDKEHPISSYGKCATNADRESKTYPIPTDWGTLFIKMDICS